MTGLLRTLAAVFCGLMLLGNTQCTQNQNGTAPNFVVTIGVQDANGNAVSSFSQGATVQFVLTVRNRSDSAQTLWFNTGEQVNFAVVNASTSNVVWTSDNGQSFAQGFVSLDFQPGEVKTFTVSWDQSDDSGNAIGTGDYEVMGGLTVYNTQGSGSAADNADSMAVGSPTADQLVPTQYRSSLALFTVQ